MIRVGSGSVPDVRSVRPGHCWPVRKLGWLLGTAGLVMVPWLVVLGRVLPDRIMVGHWAISWVGLDTMEVVGLLATAWLLRRRDDRAALTATATATLLLVDAWFDVNTSAPGAEFATAVVMALGGELPLAVLCLVIAVRTRRQPVDSGCQRVVRELAAPPSIVDP